MAEHISTSSYNNDDNGFEKVHHADLNPMGFTPPASFGVVEDIQESNTGSNFRQDPVPNPVLPSQSTPSPVITTSSTRGQPVAAVCPAKPQESQACTGCGWRKAIDPRVMELIYWRDVKKTGAVFGSALILLLSLALFSVLSVIAYLSLVILTITLTYRLYKNVIAAVQKTGDGHPFQQYLDMNISLSDDKVHKIAESVMKSLAAFISELRRLFLIEDMVDSLKFGLLLWLLTYVGAWFNGMTIIIIALVAVFTLPKFYDTYKVQIDKYFELARQKLQEVYKQIQEKLPKPGKKKQA